MRSFVGVFLLVAFVAWTLYHLVVKKDLKQQKEAFGVYLFFIIVWGIIYTFILYNASGK